MPEANGSFVIAMEQILCTVFLASEPLVGKRFVKASERKTKYDWAYFVKGLA